jgi:hypothetical protein
MLTIKLNQIKSNQMIQLKCRIDRQVISSCEYNENQKQSS